MIENYVLPSRGKYEASFGKPRTEGEIKREADRAVSIKATNL